MVASLFIAALVVCLAQLTVREHVNRGYLLEGTLPYQNRQPNQRNAQQLSSGVFFNIKQLTNADDKNKLTFVDFGNKEFLNWALTVKQIPVLCAYMTVLQVCQFCLCWGLCPPYR